jgi:hypothetical protein
MLANVLQKETKRLRMLPERVIVCKEQFIKSFWFVAPTNNVLNILFRNLEVVAIADGRLQQDPDGDWQLVCKMDPLSDNWKETTSTHPSSENLPNNSPTPSLVDIVLVDYPASS